MSLPKYKPYPVGLWVLGKMMRLEEGRTEGGIIAPDFDPKTKKGIPYFEVLKVGKGEMNEGVWVEPRVKPGDRVITHPGSQMIEVPGAMMVGVCLFRDTDVICVLKKTGTN